MDSVNPYTSNAFSHPATESIMTPAREGLVTTIKLNLGQCPFLHSWLNAFEVAQLLLVTWSVLNIVSEWIKYLWSRRNLLFKARYLPDKNHLPVHVILQLLTKKQLGICALITKEGQRKTCELQIICLANSLYLAICYATCDLLCEMCFVRDAWNRKLPSMKLGFKTERLVVKRPR